MVVGGRETTLRTMVDTVDEQDEEERDVYGAAGGVQPRMREGEDWTELEQLLARPESVIECEDSVEATEPQI